MKVQLSAPPHEILHPWVFKGGSYFESSTCKVHFTAGRSSHKSCTENCLPKMPAAHPERKKDQGLVPAHYVKCTIYTYMLATGGVCLPVTSIYPLLRWHSSFEVLWTTSGARPVERRNDFRIVWCVSSATLSRYHRILQENMKVYKIMNSKRCCVCVCVLLLGLISNTRLDIWQIHIAYVNIVNTSIANLKRSAMCSPKWFTQKTLRALKVSELIRCWLSKIMVTCSLVQLFSQVLCIILSCLVFFRFEQFANCQMSDVWTAAGKDKWRIGLTMKSVSLPDTAH